MARPIPGPRWLAVFLLVITVLAYLPGIHGDFLFDDFPNIVTNSRVHATTFDLTSLLKAANGYEPGIYGRPLATISFAVDYLIGGRNPLQFKITSLVIHLINVLLIFVFVRQVFTLRRAATPAISALAAFVVALVWAIHPLQVSSVLYVVQRMETLALSFVLLGLLAYLAGRQRQIAGKPGWLWICGSALIAGIGLLSKETAALFPCYALALELTVLRFEASNLQDQRILKTCYAGGILLAATVFVTVVVPHYAPPAMFELRNFSLSERLLTQLRVLPMYLGQIGLPAPRGMLFYYDNFEVSSGFLTPISTLLGGGVLVGLLGLAGSLRNRMPLFSLGVLLFFFSHLITSNILPLELVFEHRNYFALLGVVLAITDIVRRIPVAHSPAILYCGVSAVVIGLGALTVIRSAVWGNPFLLASDLVSKNPGSSRASNDLATLYAGIAKNDPGSPYFSLAQAEFKRGAALPGSSPLPEQGLILLAALADQRVPDAWWGNLIQKLQSNPPGPQEIASVTGLVSARAKGLLLDDKRLLEACTVLETRTNLEAHQLAQFGDYALLQLKETELATQYFRKAIKKRPDPSLVTLIAETVVQSGNEEKAADFLNYARDIGAATATDSDKPGHTGE